jgi:hypothetical protein
MRLCLSQKPTAIRLALALAALVSGSGLLTAGSPAAGGAAGALAGRSSSGPVARAARSLYLAENAHLHLVHSNEATLSERGSAAGTFTAPLTAQLTISAEHVNAVFTIYPHGGSITGRASARFIVRGHTGYYGGTLKITHGTGAYHHASGMNIGISGTIDRYSFALMVKANGWMKL